MSLQVDAAETMIRDLLRPEDESRNEHKRLQLRELAALNGTLKDEEFCFLCGSAGHRWALGVICTLCGSGFLVLPVWGR